MIEVLLTEFSRLARIGSLAAPLSGHRPILNAVYLELEDGRLRATATDSYKMASTVAEVHVEGTPSRGEFMVPAAQLARVDVTFRSIEQLRSLVMPIVKVEAKEHTARFVLQGSTKEAEIVTDVVEGKFPTYRALLQRPDDPPTKSALKRMRKDDLRDLIRQRYGRYVPEEGHTRETLLDIIDEELAKPFDRSVSLNPEYLSQILKSTTGVNSSGIRIDMYGVARPIFLTNRADPDWVGIQMPVRTN